MGSLDNFMNKFGNSVPETEPSSSLLSAGAPNALAVFMDKFSTKMESYFFYNGTIELRFDKEDHKYYLVEPLGNLSVRNGVTTVCHVIDRSMVLMPWAVKKAAERLLKLVKVVDVNGTLMLEPMSLAFFTQLVMEAKKAPDEEKVEAGDIGHMAHECLEDSIRYVLEHTEDHIVRELKNTPTDEKAAAAALSGFNWMKAHNVRWIETESKIYSKEYGYAGTMDGLALVDSCSDRTCCRHAFKDHLSLIDWKSSNYLYIEYLFQTASYQHAKQEESGMQIVDRWVLRLGKNEEEAGKFEPWYMGPEDFAEDFAGFVACLNLVNLLDSVNNRMKDQKNKIRAIKKEVKATQKAAAKAEEKLQKARNKALKQTLRQAEKEAAKVAAEQAKNELRVARAAEKARIKEEARVARQAAKLDQPKVAPVVPVAIVADIRPVEAVKTKPGWEEFEEEVQTRTTVFTIPEEE